MSANLAANQDRGKWMALVAALLGWMFDGFEIGIFPLVGPNALDELLHSQIAAHPAVKDNWFGVIMAVFLVGAATGGVIFGWLGDCIGRVRAMSLSIFTYAIFTGFCGFATQAWQIAALRFIASLGMGGEWALGVALVLELWPDRSRALLAGTIGAASNVGFLLVGLLSLILVSFISSVGTLLLSMNIPQATVTKLIAGDGWRLLMIAGSLPALLVFFILRFVPESHKWEAQQVRGGTSHWATRDLLGILVGALGALAVIFVWSPVFSEMLPTSHDINTDPVAPTVWANTVRVIVTAAGLLIALGGYMFPVVRYLGRAVAANRLLPRDSTRYIRRMLLGACLSGVALLGTWGSLQWAPKWAIALSRQLPADQQTHFAKEYTQICLAAGAIVGTILAALLCDWFGRRPTYFGLCVASFLSLVYMYGFNNAYGPKLLLSAVVAGGITAAFYGWFPLYLPELFPTSIRATSQGFAYNFGRVLSAIGSLQTAGLTAFFAHNIPKERIEVDAFPKAGATLAGIYLIGLFIIWLGPETKGKLLPE